MDLVQLHTFEPLRIERIRAELAELIPAGWLERWARLDVSISDPWRPCDLWPEAPERQVWTATFTFPDAVFFTGAGEEEAGQLCTLARRQAPIHPGELLARQFGAALVIWHSDAGRSAYVSLWRERQIRWSLRLDEAVGESGRRSVRCDGQQVLVEAPPRHLPESDRAGVLLAGWARFLAEPLPVEGADRLVFVDTLEALTSEVPAEIACSRPLGVGVGAGGQRAGDARGSRTFVRG